MARIVYIVILLAGCSGTAPDPILVKPSASKDFEKGDKGQNSPPFFNETRYQVTKGEPKALAIYAEDPDGDDLEFTITGIEELRGVELSGDVIHFDPFYYDADQVVRFELIAKDQEHEVEAIIGVVIIEEDENIEAVFEMEEIDDVTMKVGEEVNIKIASSDEGKEFAVEFLVKVAEFITLDGKTIRIHPTEDSHVLETTIKILVTDNIDLAEKVLSFKVTVKENILLNEPPTTNLPISREVLIDKKINITIKAQDPEGDDIEITLKDSSASGFSLSGDILTFDASGKGAGKEFVARVVTADSNDNKVEGTVTLLTAGNRSSEAEVSDTFKMPSPNMFSIRNVALDRCLRASSGIRVGDNGDEVYLSACTSSDDRERWSLKKLGDGAFSIINDHTGFCLNASQGIKTKAGSPNIFATECKGNNQQKFTLVSKNNKVKIKNAASSTCSHAAKEELTSSNSPQLVQKSCRDASSQEFILQ